MDAWKRTGARRHHLGLVVAALACWALGGCLQPPLPPPAPPSHLARGIELYHARRFDDAVAVLERAVRARSRNDSMAWTYLGLARFDTHANDQARVAFERALELDATNGEAYYGLGRAHRRQGRLQTSIHAFERAVRVKPNHADAHFQLGLTLDEIHRPAHAIAHFEIFLALTPEDPDAARAQESVERLRRRASVRTGNRS